MKLRMRISKASCFFPHNLIPSVITIIRSWWNILPDIFLCILYESPFFFIPFMFQPCARPCNYIGLGDVPRNVSQGNHYNPLSNLLPVSLTRTISWFTPTASRRECLKSQFICLGAITAFSPQTRLCVL